MLSRPLLPDAISKFAQISELRSTTCFYTELRYACVEKWPRWLSARENIAGSSRRRGVGWRAFDNETTRSKQIYDWCKLIIGDTGARGAARAVVVGRVGWYSAALPTRLHVPAANAPRRRVQLIYVPRRLNRLRSVQSPFIIPVPGKIGYAENIFINPGLWHAFYVFDMLFSCSYWYFRTLFCYYFQVNSYLLSLLIIIRVM